MRKLLKLLPAFLLVYSYSNSQDFSNKGRDFWVAYGYHQVMTVNNGQEMVLYFATEAATNVTVTIPGIGYTANYSIPANTVFTSNPIPKGVGQDARLLTESTAGENKGIHIVSDQPIVAYAHIYNASVSGASILFPTNTLGREYYSINYTNRSNTPNANSWAYVIATDTGTTTVEITPSAATLTKPAGVPFTVTLTQGQVFNIMGDFTNAVTGNNHLGVDLTGTLIRSLNTGAGCKKLAVFSGSGRISITCNTNSSSSDNYMSQAFPKNAWGKKYLTATAAGNQANNFYRVCVSDPTAVVTLNGGPIGVPLVNNFYYDLPITNQPLRIESDKPIIVTQYFTSQGACGNGAQPGDPEVIYLSPVEQNINKVLWNATPNFNILNHYFNVVIPNGGTAISSFQLRDGTGAVVPTGAFTVHPRDANYSYLKQPLPSSGVYSIQSDSGFNAIAYGFGNAESYGYNAGTNVVDLYQYVSTQNANATVNSPVACKSSPFNMAITLPYIPLNIKWVITGYPTVNNNSPVPDSTFVLNGKTLYLFRLPTPYIYNVVGIYPVTVTVNNPTPDGCTGEQIINFNLQVFGPPTADFTWASKGCTDSIIPMTTNNTTGGRPITKHFWDFGDGTFAYVNNPTKVYTNPGTYTIRYAVLTDIGCLSDTTVKTISVTRTPTAKFGYVAASCVGKLITFSDSSLLTGGFGNIVNWNWNLGVGAPINNSSNANVSATYPATTLYNPTLQVTTNTGCVSPLFTLPITIRPNPVPNFTMSFACLPDGVVSFTNTSTIADGSQGLFLNAWNFGDPSTGPLNTSSVTNPTHKYTTVGPYSIKLKVTSNYGCVDSITRVQANIYPQPKADFTAPAEVCWQSPVTFTDGSNGFTHPVTQWRWSFSDGTTSTIRNPVKNFATPGTYTATLFVFTNQGCVSDTITKTVIVNPWPTAANTLSTPLCEKNQITITDNSVPNAGSLVRWYWNLDDGTIINATNNNPITHTYANWGNKVVKLLVESSKGCRSDTLIKTIRINPLPRVGYVLPEVCLSDANAFFFDTTRIADNSESLMTYLWKFNTGSPAVVPGPTPGTSTNKNPSIRFNKADNYLLSLTVTSKDGCRDSVSNIPFTVNGSIPNANFILLPTNGLCSNQDIQIQEKSTVDFGALTKVEIYWDYVNAPTVFETDDNPVTDKIYSHRYPNFQSPLTRTFRIRYRAYTGIICVNDEIRDIVVNASPLTQFTAMPGICLDAVARQITQAVELGGLPGTGVYTGPGVSSTGLFNPAAAGVGIHRIRYTFTAANGCTHFSEQTIEVYPRPAARFVSLLPSCEKNMVMFSDSSVANATSINTWNVDFGDGTPIISYPNKNNIAHVFANYGNYNVVLQVVNNRGCTSVPATLPVRVHPLPRVDFNFPKVCLPAGTATFTNLSTIPDNTDGQFRYKWDFGDGFVSPAGSDTSVIKNPIYTYRNLGPYTVSLKVTSNNNCIDSATKQLVDVFPQPKAAFDSKDSLCLGDLVNFTDESDGIVRDITQWNWNFGNGVTSSVQNPAYLYTIPGFYNVKLQVYSSEGCISDTATKTVNVWPYPALAPGPDIVMLEDGIRKITEFGASATSSQFLWTPPTYLDDPTLKNPTIIRPKDDILYTIYVTGRGGCLSRTTLFVKVLKMPKPPNTFTPNGDGINDFWEIKYLYDYPGCVVEIYNTAGTIVHRSVGYSTPWDGKWKGQQLPAGTYYYVIDPKNGRSRISGYVTILR
ncbi:MAG: PKD domain-containing protein [Chitinophagaceae bacterium]|nr:PKD domain-containing protein [Chitinophagaceae bacterium]